MLWEHNSTIVVMLTKLREMGRVRTFFSFQLEDLCNGMDKSVWKEIIAIERISFYVHFAGEVRSVLAQ